ncbi:hypothetical protein BGW36DRAFT_311235 [Talaromyces proteolyticus]|uniref:ML-like domain-containing protein n=1 Tax=Talaromyces proteolyticus TaxID=1131652 RepID=A0AAD4Q6E3_9EURO|nr:uncharacterized protein BGW36DRAFT_311235 [Talaromyces proteolyticus]KAH8705611.1 hypothetical protein BGW36DRAFT_311235 [Talaromyces proteolyticus]
MARIWFSSSLSLALILLCWLWTAVIAAGTCIEGEDSSGQRICLDDQRKPTLWTLDFGDCQGDSLLNVTQLQGAYYADNMTVTFNLVAQTSLVNDDIMVYIGVYAYGETRFELTLNPCNNNFQGLCPLNAGTTAVAAGAIPIGESYVASIPSIAYSIPDFEGQVVFRILSNATQSQIGCFAAVLTNGYSFAQPAAVSSILGIFTIVAVVSSLAAAVYGPSTSSNRNHYAHSPSVLVAFAIFHHIFFTGALSMNWPSVLVAFWANYAWAAGMIYSVKMQDSINQFLGSNRGNISMVGAASAGVDNANLAGGIDISQIYKRSQAIFPRANDGGSFYPSPWHGGPVKPGLPIPGNYSGFAGTLAEETIPASNAFLTGLIWWLVLVSGLCLASVVLKLVVDGFAKYNKIGEDKWQHFRTHWLAYTISLTLRGCFVGFYVLSFLALFQFTLGGSTGVKAIAGVVLALIILLLGGAAGFAVWDRFTAGQVTADKLLVKQEKIGVLPYLAVYRASRLSEEKKASKNVLSVPWWTVTNGESESSVHETELFVRKFGWLSGRFRRTRWYFFAVWLVYEFVRACFFGGAAGHPMTQVFGILAVEFIALVTMIWMKPFEAARLNTLTIYLLGFSKVSTVALSSAFDSSFNIDRMTTAAIGIVIIVIQGILTVFLLMAICVGAISTYMSISRDKVEEEFKPKSLRGLRSKYLAHVEKAGLDLPPSRSRRAVVEDGPVEVSFEVRSVQRQLKIEDEDDRTAPFPNLEMLPVPEEDEDGNEEQKSGPSRSVSQQGSDSVRSSGSYSNLPFGARPHVSSWSSQDFSPWVESQRLSGRRMSGRGRGSSAMSLRQTAMRQRANSRGTPLPMTRSESPATVQVPDADDIPVLSSLAAPDFAFH